jgi:hypothetical protein
MGVPISQVVERPPVSPESTPTASWTGLSQVHIASQHTKIGPGSSALGDGGPSDWEHFQASFEDSEAEGTSASNAQSHSGNPTLDNRYAELPASLSRSSSKRESSAQTVPSVSSIPAVNEVPLREHSVSPEPSVEGLLRTGTIDGVIQAWSTPLQTSLPRGTSRKSSVSTLDRSRGDTVDSIQSSPQRALQRFQVEQHQRGAFEHDTLAGVIQEAPFSPSRASSCQPSTAPPVLSKKHIEVDPYADLGPEYRASLARYVVTLKKEEAAPEDERYKIFQAFVLKETQLRSILYGVEPDDTEGKPPPQDSNRMTEHEAVVVKALPMTAPGSAASLPTHASTAKSTNRTHMLTPKLTVETPSAANEESYVVVERDEQSEYSPGGRPRISRTAPRRTASHPPPKSPPKATSSPSDYAPMVVDELMQPPGNSGLASIFKPPPRPGTAPLVMQNGPMKDPIKFEPPRPAYMPFRYAEGPQSGSEPTLLSRPAYEAYSALRHQSVDSGRVMAQSTTNVKSPTRRDTFGSPTIGTARREHEEAFLGLIREKSRYYRKGKQGKSPGTPVNDLLSLPDPVDRQAQVISDLRKFIPPTMPHQRQPGPRILQAEQEMSKYPNVFSWIPETVVTWDRRNRAVRKTQEEERQARQEESEKNIDALFNDHEIGYSDIGQLESDFKLAEATRKYNEDVKELETFTDQVFKPVTERLKEELVQLNAQYIRAVDLLEHEADSGSLYIQGTDDHASGSAAMTILLALYNKMQIRHVKTTEAHYERERRRKKLELSILLTNGDMAAMKKLEQEFSIAERQQALHEARENDTRANRLMDTVDRATVRGLGDNQHFVDEVVAKLQSVNEVMNATPENAKELLVAGLHEILRAAEEILNYISTDSKALLTMSNQANNMLNNADYDVSVAEARVGDASQESMKTLEEKKGKEDERIKAEVDTRLGIVAKGPEHALALVRNIMKRTGVDPQHQDRVQKALEAAKLRNAIKSPVG